MKTYEEKLNVFQDSVKHSYVFCFKCNIIVFEYCSLHGPSLVIPDTEVKIQHELIPRSVLTMPHEFLYLALSMIQDAGIGVFSCVTIPRGVRFGPYRGVRTPDVRSMYCWQIKPQHTIDSSDENSSNWLRYVNCARNYHEQNLIAHNYKGEIYYCSIKIIPRNTELLVFYGCEFALDLDIDLRIYNDHISSSSGNETNDGKNKPDLKEISYKPNVYETLPHTITVNNIGTEINSTANKNPHSINDINKSMATPDTTKKNFTCEICNKSFNKQYVLKRHKVIHLDYKIFKCTYCDFRTNHLKSLKTHTNLHTKEIVYKCEFCNKLYYNKRTLQDHRRTHLK